MENLLCIKGKIIGKGKPLVCVPVMESSKEEILRETRRLEEAHTEMIEWRVDAFENVESPNAIREILNEMKHIIRESILVYTFRSKNQGGCKALSAADIYDIHQVAAESDVVDFIDVEYFEAKNPQKEIARLQEMGVYVIASHHDFEQTPDPEVIRMLLEQIRESGADVVKLAVMPQNMWDVLHLLEETNRFHENHPDHPLITMSMGAKGGDFPRGRRVFRIVCDIWRRRAGERTGAASGKAAGRNTSYFTSKCGLTLNLKCDIVKRHL